MTLVMPLPVLASSVNPLPQGPRTAKAYGDPVGAGLHAKGPVQAASLFGKQPIPTPGTERRPMLMRLFVTRRAFMLQLLPAHGIGQFGGKDAGRHGNDRITGNHHQRRQHLPQRRLWHDVAKAYGGEGDGPVDAFGDAGKAVLRPFDHVHQRAEHRHQGRYRHQEHDDLSRLSYRAAPPSGSEPA